METTREVLMKRDHITKEEADSLILTAKIALDHYLMNNDLDSADNICQEYFGLEQDYIMDLI